MPSLTPTQKSLALDAFLHGMSPQDIATRLSLDYDDVYAYLNSQKLEALRRYLDPVPGGIGGGGGSGVNLTSSNGTISITNGPNNSTNLTLGFIAPVITAALKAVGATTPLTVSVVAPTSGDAFLYCVSLYMQSGIHAGASGHEVECIINYDSPLGHEIINLFMLLDQASQQIVMETYPLMVIAGGTISLSTAYVGGATNDPYTISARIVQMF